MLTVSHSGVPVIYKYGDKIHKTLKNVLNQNANVTKQPGFSTFAISIVDKLCLPQQYK